VGAASLLLITLLAGVAGTTWQAIEARRQRAQALAERDRAEVLLARNDAIFEFFETMLTEGVTAEQANAIQKMLERGTGFIDVVAGSQPERQAEILRVLSTYYINLDNAKKASALLERARALVPENGDRSLSARLACEHAGAMVLLGQRKEAIELLDRWTADPGIDDNIAASCLEARASIAQADVDAKQALQFTEQALQRLRRGRAPSAKLEATLLGDLGFALHLSGKSDEAEKRYEEALALLTRIGQREGREAR